MDDWERAYEEDRRRLELGQNIVVDSHRGNTTVNTFEEKISEDTNLAPVSMPYIPPMNIDPTLLELPATTTTATSALLPRAKNMASQVSVHRDEAEVLEIYAQYNNEPLPREKQIVGVDVEDKTTQQELTHDVRFNLGCLPYGWNLSSLFGTKMGRRLFFAETAKTVFKGFISSKDTLVVCFVTPNCIYIGDVQTGALTIGIDIQLLSEIHVFDIFAVGLKTLDGFGLYLQTQQHTGKLVDVLRKITSYWRVNVTIIRANADQAKSFKKGLRLIDKKSYNWELVEDPRTGLRIVNITEGFVRILAPIATRILHWFGFLQQFSTDWKGSRTKKRRCAWITATCFFVAKPEGPGSEGRGILSCVAMEYMTELYVGPGGELGISATAGPPQLPLFIVFDSEEEKNKVLFILQECYNYRKGGGSIKVTPVDGIEKKSLGVKKFGDSRSQVFRMRLQRELYEFLRGPATKK